MATVSTAKQKGNKWVTVAIEGAILLLALAISLAVRFGIYESAIVISRSMEPTLSVGDRLIIDHRSSLAGTWRRGDIVMFDAPPSWSEASGDGGPPERFIKRIVGMPGETIDITPDGQVYINGGPKPLSEPYIARSALSYPLRIALGTGQYFVMGDNRPNSDDSRRSGPISEADIHGRAVRVFWPPGRARALPPPAYD